MSRVDGTAKLQVKEGSATSAARTLGELVNNGPVGLRLADTGAGSAWNLGSDADSGFALRSTIGSSALTALRIDPHGTVSAAGALQQAVDPAAQDGVENVDPNAVLEAIEGLSIERFSYAGDPSGAEHLAPAGAAFRSALGLGADDKQLAPGDVAGAALAGVRALADRPVAEDERVPTLVSDLARLKDDTTAARTATDDRVAGVTTSVAALEALVKQFDARIGALDARTTEQAQVAASRTKRLEQTTTTLTTRVASLRKSRATMTGRIRQLERAQRAQDRRNASLATNNASLRKRLAAVESAVAKLR